MKYAVFSDVHGNLPALELMLKDAGSVDGYISLGDVVDYGPWANECVSLIASLPNCTTIRGNHEDYFLSGSYGGTSPTAKAFFEFCYPSFERQDIIKNYQPELLLNGFLFTHTILNQNIYPDAVLTLDANYVVGHSHHQFKILQPPFSLYNPGSVGQNRKYINVINYMLLDDKIMEFTMKSLKYDVDAVINEMKQRSYPEVCIDYYNNKSRLA